MRQLIMALVGLLACGLLAACGTPVMSQTAREPVSSTGQPEPVILALGQTWTADSGISLTVTVARVDGYLRVAGHVVNRSASPVVSGPVAHGLKWLVSANGQPLGLDTTGPDYTYVDVLPGHAGDWYQDDVMPAAGSDLQIEMWYFPTSDLTGVMTAYATGKM